ncbi:MAG: hypothetical protein ACI9XO_002650 [Paraglaciecola sp.]|jgi:hypothetical protein
MMQKIIIITFTFMLLSISLLAQAPSKFNYQAVARNADGELMHNQPIQVRFSIINNESNGITLYTETHTEVITNQFGLFSLAVGELATNDDFENVNWSMGNKYLKVEIDPNNNGGFFDLGAIQLLSVPYAIHAKTAGSGGGTGTQGNPGNGIQSTTFNSGLLTLEYDDGTTFTTPNLTGPQGLVGQDGQDGTGVLIVGSVTSTSNLPAIYNGNVGDMFITQNDGHGHVWDGTQFVDVGQIKGPEGEQGLQGIAGTNGINGQNGTNGTNGQNGADGQNGNGITSVMNNGNGTFTLSFNDGNTFTTSDLTGSQGNQGTQGIAGQNGQNGADGVNGQDGAGVMIVGSIATAANLEVNYSGNIGDMIITQNDGHGHVWDGNGWNDVGQIQGPQGPQGSSGQNGTNGINGLDGNGITSVNDNGNGTYTFNFTNGTTYTTADLTGPQGLMGSQGPQGNMGLQGPQGNTGSQGMQGIPGNYTAGTGIEISGNTINSLWAENTNDVVLAPSSQNVGIGITNPDVQLHVANNIKLEGIIPRLEFEFNDVQEMEIYSNGPANINATNGLNIRANTNGGISHINFYNNGQVGLEITDDLEVGIRTSSPNAAFHVVHKLTTGGGDSREDGFKLQNEGNGNNYWTMYVQNGTGDLHLLSRLNNHVGTFDDVSGAYSAVSDKRLKKNVENEEDILHKVLQLAVLKYHFLPEIKSDKKHYGLFAQDVEKLFPEVVKYDKNEDQYTMDYSAFGVLAVKAIQEQQQEVDELKKGLAELKAAVKALQE